MIYMLHGQEFLDKLYTVGLYSWDGSNTTNSDNYERRDITLAI